MPSNQATPSDGAALPIRGVSNIIPCDRRSITESLGSERTSSSVSMYRGPALFSGGLRLDKSDSRSSIERNSDGVSPSLNLRIENFISQKVVLQMLIYLYLLLIPKEIYRKRSCSNYNFVIAPPFRSNACARYCIWSCCICI